MCGILGWFGPDEIRPEFLESVSRRLRHRGPDGDGWASWGRSGLTLGRRLGEDPASVCFGHRRLAILDLSEGGWQPMVDASGRFVLVFNGEVYNYIELREELTKGGDHFRSGTDTEVVLAAWTKWGTESLRRFVGMFALAVLDTTNRTVTLARDPFGIKPLYYARCRMGWSFASEIPPLLDLPDVSRQVNPGRLVEYLRLGLTDHHRETLLRDIHQVPAGTFLRFKLEDLSQPAAEKCAPRTESNDAGIGFSEAVDQTRELFLRNISLHLRSDVPVGAALSGGIDSSAIVCAIRHLRPDQELHAFSFVAARGVSEEHWIDKAAGSARAICHKVKPAAGDLARDFEELVRGQGEPIGSASVYAQYRIFKEARANGIKVMLDGQGADEILAGYQRAVSSRLTDLIAERRPFKAAKVLFGRHTFGKTRLIQGVIVQGAPDWAVRPIRLLLGRQSWPSWLNGEWFEARGIDYSPYQRLNGASRFLKEDLALCISRESLPAILRYEDRNSMVHSIESRVPFLTKDFADFVSRLPDEYLVSSHGVTKSIFREAMRGIVPDVLLERRDKVQFVAPEAYWLDNAPNLVELLLKRGVAEEVFPVVNMEPIRRRVKSRGLQSEARWPIWRIVSAVIWSRVFSLQFT